MKKLLPWIIGLVVVGLFTAGVALAVTPFNSSQLAPSASNGNCLTTNGTINAWSSSCGSGGGGGSGGGWSTSTPNIIFNSFGTTVGINSTTPSSPLVVKGISGSTTPTFIVTSSTNSSLLSVASNGSTTLSSLASAGNVQSTAGGSLYVNPQTGSGLNVLQTSPTLITPILGVASSTSLSVSGNLYTNLTQTNIPIAGVGGLLQNSSLSQSGGTTLINGATPLIDGGGDWLNNVIQTSGANFIVQTPTSTLVAGNVVFGGGVQQINTTTYLSPTQFCTGGLFYLASTTAFSLFLPTLAQVGLGLAPSNCTNSIYSGNWSPQFISNGGSAAVTTNASGSGETLMFAPGTGPTLYSGQSYFNVGQFTASSTILGATTTGMSLNAYLSAFQPTSTQPTTMGQILSADSTGHGWQLTNLVAGTNITLTTSTPGQITVTASGGAGTNYWSTVANGIFNNSGYLVGINSTTPIANLSVQGSSTSPTLPVLTVASSSNASLLTVLPNGNVGIGSSSPNQALTIYGALSINSSSTLANTAPAIIYEATDTANSNLSALYILPPRNNERIFFGDGTYKPFSLNFSNTSNLENVPSFSTTGSVTAASGNVQANFFTDGTNVKGYLQTNVSGYNFDVVNRVTGNVNMRLQGIAGQTADIFQISSSTTSNIFFNVTPQGRIGIGSTTPGSLLSVQGSSTAPTIPILTVASSSGTSYLSVSPSGWEVKGGDGAGIVSSCGTGSPTVIGNDQGGIITTGTAATTCTLTFKNPIPAGTTLACNVTDDSLVGFADISATSTSAVSFGISSALSGGHLYFQCGAYK